MSVGVDGDGSEGTRRSGWNREEDGEEGKQSAGKNAELRHIRLRSCKWRALKETGIICHPGKDALTGTPL